MNQLHAKATALENALAPIFEKLPHLPKEARDTLVVIAPWLALVFGALGLFAVLSALSTLPMLLSMPFAMAAMGGSWYMPMLLAMLICGVSAVLDLLAFKPLSAHKKTGWNLLFYGTLLSVLSSIINMVFGFGGFTGLIGAVIGFWLLFEVRGHYSA
ncbi:MAG: hypothetical protein HOO67_07575 [Candidatus Peribacteraceae bacterium]|nr:hypothetical protein [Candidatus Peribacteraceae bacterium]